MFQFLYKGTDIWHLNLQRLSLLNDNTPYYQISRTLEAVRYDLELVDYFENWQAWQRSAEANAKFQIDTLNSINTKHRWGHMIAVCLKSPSTRQFV